MKRGRGFRAMTLFFCKVVYDYSRMDKITTRLGNGLRVVAARALTNVTYIGVAVNAGSRDDYAGAPGLAHFVEHTIFKGTPSRKSKAVSTRMESVGGELNAYTTKEETLIYTNAPHGYASRALELLADLTANAGFPEKEIDLERGVILEEIFSYRDNPADNVFDEFEEQIYHGSEMAHNILGYDDSITGITPDLARRFLEEHYIPSEMALYIVDNCDPEKSIRLAEKYFGMMPERKSILRRSAPAVPDAPGRHIVEGDNHQANTITGVRVPGYRDRDRHALFLLNNILGGPAMNSRLNLELRERRGLVYTVESNVALASDCGTFAVYYGCDPANTERCRRLIRSEMERLAERNLSDRAFRSAVNQYCGQLTVSGDQNENLAMTLGKSLLYYNEIHDIDYTVAKIRSLTPDDLRTVAERLAESPECFVSIR